MSVFAVEGSIYQRMIRAHVSRGRTPERCATEIETMERRKFMLGLGSVAAGGSALVGSGAFTSVEADRTVEVNLANDANAYLALTGDNKYVTDDSGNGTLTIDLGGPGTGKGGQGFNDDAITEVEGVVEIRNQGTNAVEITVDNGGVDSGIEFSVSGGSSIAAGDTATLDVTVDTLNYDPSGGTLTIHANA